MMSETLVSETMTASPASAASGSIEVRAMGRGSRARHRPNLRERVLAALLCALLAWTACSWVFPGRADSATAPMQVTAYTVRPGDTLWTYAEMITPEGGDVSQSVEELIRLNGLDSHALRAGQRIVVPASQSWR